MLKILKVLILIPIIAIFSQIVFSSPIIGEEYVKKLKEFKPSKSIYALLEDPKSGAGYVEVRGRVMNIFEFGENSFFTLHFDNNNPNSFIYIKLPETIDKEEIANKDIACILKWDLLSINQNLAMIQLNQDEHYEIEQCALLDGVIEYEAKLYNKNNTLTQFGKPVNFVLPTELSTPEEQAEKSTQNAYNINTAEKNKIFNIIKSVNKNISDSIATAYSDFILTYSVGHGVDPLFVCAILTQESRFKNSARSKVGAQGLGQLMPYTASGLGVLDPFDPKQNIYGTTKYLKNASKQLFGKYPKELNLNQLKLLAASYNSGPRAVKKYHGVPPYSETQNYVVKVLGYYMKYLNI